MAVTLIFQFFFLFSISSLQILSFVLRSLGKCVEKPMNSKYIAKRMGCSKRLQPFFAHSTDLMWSVVTFSQ